MTRAAVSPSPLSLEHLRTHIPTSMRASLQSARELERGTREVERERDPLPTALPSLDRLLSGGLPRGHLVELIGSRSSGRFSTVLQIIAAATSAGEDTALIDLGDGLDPVDTARAGADLARLLWLRPVQLAPALAAAEMVIGCGFPLVIMDLGVPPVRSGQRHESAWLRLARAARQRGCAFLVASPYRVSSTAASAVLRAGHAHPLWESSHRGTWRAGSTTLPLLAGATSSLALEKHRGHSVGAVVQQQPLSLRGAESLTSLRSPASIPASAASHEDALELPARRRSAQR